MAIFGPSNQNATITTGNFRTTVDLFTATQPGTYPLPNGQKNPLGTSYYDATVSLAFPSGLGAKYRYVRYNSTANPALLAAPAPVYWTDNTFTTVTGVLSESLGGAAGINNVAGYLMPNTGDLTTLTAAILNGNFVWICVGGLVLNAIVPASTAVGDAIIGATGNFTNARVAANTAPTNKVLAWAEAAVAAGVANVMVAVEN
jgi:hypothetical protein